MIRNHDRKFKIGMHSYTLHLSGFGESWGFQEYGEHHLSLYGLISGMGVMAVSLLLFL